MLNGMANANLIIWYGNTQALTTVGQYELVGKVLDIAQQFGCRFVISIGGFKKDEAAQVPGIYTTATDMDTMQQALDLGTKVYGWTRLWYCRFIGRYGTHSGHEGFLAF